MRLSKHNLFSLALTCCFLMAAFASFGQNFINNGGFESPDATTSYPSNGNTYDNTTDFLGDWRRSNNNDQDANSPHSPDWRYISTSLWWGRQFNFDVDYSGPPWPQTYFNPASGNGMLGMAPAELIQQKFDVGAIQSALQSGIVNPSLKIRFKIRIPNKFKPQTSTKLSLLLSKNKLKYKSDNQDYPCDENDNYRKIGNSNFSELLTIDNLTSNFPPGEWHQVEYPITLPSNYDVNDWIGIDLRSFTAGSGLICDTDEYIYLDDIELTLGCEDGCSSTDGSHAVNVTSNVIHNSSTVVIDNLDNITDLSFVVFMTNGQIVYQNDISCPNGIDHEVRWDGKSIGGADVSNAIYEYIIQATNECYTTEWIGSILKTDDYTGTNLSNFDEPCQNGGNPTPEPCCYVDFYIDDEVLIGPPYSKYIIQENIWACTRTPDFSDEVRIENGADVLFRAGKQITLAEGFNTKDGAVFLAEILPDHCERPKNGEGTTGNSSHGSGESPEKSEKTDPVAKPNLVSAYPNPTNGSIHIESKFGIDGIVLIEIHDILGNSIYSKQKTGFQRLQIDLSDQRSGIYFVNIISDNEKFSLKLIKQ